MWAPAHSLAAGRSPLRPLYPSRRERPAVLLASECLRLLLDRSLVFGWRSASPPPVYRGAAASVGVAFRCARGRRDARSRHRTETLGPGVAREPGSCFLCSGSHGFYSSLAVAMRWPRLEVAACWLPDEGVHADQSRPAPTLRGPTCHRRQTVAIPVQVLLP